ncbi:hypothetical protein [Clostridium sp.]|uniref:zinc-ribbon domain-containing protein n=1 Tax=Clostridium sp. TaxID=1506 RepID=UPI0025BBC271|nr:hypothetical protein [Clostridium sp.]
MPKKLTHEEFMEKFYEQNKNAENIEILGKYEGSKIKIKCKCKLDGYEWEIRPNDLLSKKVSCPKCSGNTTKTTEEFIQEMKEINNDIEILGEYVNNKIPIKCKCKIDGYEWMAKPNNLLSSNSGCPKCYDNRRGNTLKLTHKEFISRIKEINDDIEILGKYKNSKTKIKVRCKKDGYTWEVTPNSLLNNKTGCPKCAGNMKLTHEEFISRINIINPNIEILGTYIKNNIKIKCKCKIDGYIWYTTPSNLLREQGCPKCGIKSQVEKRTKTHEQFIQELQEINPNIEILGEYVNNHTKIKYRCKIDGNIWYAIPHSLLSGQGCPKCNSSKGEKRISEYLNNKNMKYKEQYKFKDCKFKKRLPFDFYIPSLNLCIEYDGGQHYEIVKWFGGLDGFIDTKIRDTIKTIYCKENNIRLIRIPYWDFDRIEEILDRELEEK